MTIALVAALFFGGNDARACAFLYEYGYMRRMVSPSRFPRRRQRMKDLFLTVFAVLAEHWKTLNSEAVYVIASVPIARCATIRIGRSRRYRGPA